MKRIQHHMIDLLFPIALFFVFASTALAVLVLSANSYQSIQTGSEASFEQNTALSYLTEKIRQNDVQGDTAISLCELEDYPALAISQSYLGKPYVTYIYVQDGQLKELFTQAEIPVYADAGTPIMQVDDLQMQQLTDNLFQFTCTSKNGSHTSAIVCTKSTTP